VAVQVLAGLDHIHRRGLLHRDISADNIMLSYERDDSLVAKIIDLGIAKDVNVATNETQAGMLVGNPKYMSPEQLGDLAAGEQVDNRADLYCLGVVLYEMLLGVPPFVSETPHGYIVKHLTQPPRPSGAVTPDIEWPDGPDTTEAKARMFELSLIEEVREREKNVDREGLKRLAEGHPPGSLVGNAARDALTRLRTAQEEAQQEENDFQRAWEDGTSSA